MDMQALFKRLGGIKPIASDKFNPMTEAEIASIEKERGIRLPKSYRQFLATYGASTFNGCPPDNPFIIFHPLESLPPQFVDGTDLFDAFYGAQREEYDSFSLRVQMRFYAKYMPESLIPIGDDGGAGLICLGVKGAELGKVYYWERQNAALDEEDYLADYGEPRPAEALFQNVHLIAQSFEDFLQRLEIQPD